MDGWGLDCTETGISDLFKLTNRYRIGMILVELR
jgi:hypothetical protein